ncbi:MAG: PKD domain-containing protein [Candidatus Moduliflexus flocculans]|nr:PKD domain-containing protein [Candidatus Moduliflexus flocculans]
MALWGSRPPGWDSYLNSPIPSIYTPNHFIAPFWDDLDPAAGGAVYSLLEGEAPNRRLTVAWVDVPHGYWTGGAVSFEATLFEGSNEIVFQYQDVTFGSAYYDAGASATVGVENVDGTDGTQFLHEQPLLSDAMALKWRPIPYHRRPIASPGGPYQGYVNEPVVFDGTASSDPEGRPLSYRWNFEDGTTGSGPTPSHVYAAKGTYWVSLVVNDGDFDSPPATAKVVIPNRAPVPVPGGPYSGRIGVPIAFDGSGSYDPDGDAITSYRWTLGNSTVYGVSPSYTFNWRGTYPVTLWVSDGSAYSPEASTTVKVISPIPVANAGPDQRVASRAFVTLDGRGSYDEDGTIVSYAWRQISGKDVRLSGTDTATPTYTAPPFNAPCSIGYFQEFELTVTDNDGNTVTDVVAVTVYARGCWGL